MLNILIVDDDPMSRKGIRTLMPWSDHQMRVIGEASNGREALEFLRDNDVDLVLVDLDMPVMGGLELIRQASPLYPDVNYVILTVHTEFEYVQDALHLGVIDYLAKNQLDQEHFPQIISRIKAGITKKDSLKQPSSLKWMECTILTPSIYALITISTDDEECISQFWNLNQMTMRSDIYEIISGVWVFADERKKFLFPECFSNTMLLNILDVQNMTYSQLGSLLRFYLKNQFFYDYRPLKEINCKRVYELKEQEYILDQETLQTLMDNWSSLNWIQDNQLFHRLKFYLKNSKLKPSSLYHMLLTLENVWNSYYSGVTNETLTLPASFRSWEEVEEWLVQLYEKTSLFHVSTKYAPEITQNILSAKTYVDTHYASLPESSEIARRAHMSYGYFSRCFHDIVGCSFSDYCIQVRIQQAKNLLTGTRHTLQQIAFEVGYHDEKYFSRIFKKITGQSPSEYRKNMASQKIN